MSLKTSKQNRQSASKPGSAPGKAAFEKRHLIRFLVVYLLLVGGFFVLTSHQGFQKILDVNGLYSQFVVSLSLLAFKPFGILLGSQGTLIHLQGLSMDVRFGCNGLEACLIYITAVLAFPARLAHKIVGIVGGFILLQGLNILRIVGLGLSGVYLREYFEMIHVYVAQGLMIALALILFLVWLGYASPE